MSDADIVKALRASIKFDAIHGTEMERAICGSQMIRAADEITSLRTELAAMRERVEWQPIETAPRDGTRVLVRNDRGVFAASWFTEDECEDAHFDGWFIDDGKFNLRTIRGNAVTHWLPIPTDTKETGNGS